jgi:hypothetical protein
MVKYWQVTPSPSHVLPYGKFQALFLEFWAQTHPVIKLFKFHLLTVLYSQGRLLIFLGPVTTALILEATKMQWIGPKDFLLIRTWEEEAVRISI